ncbi:MAG: SDR family NAD(P)-dependent oxidoreductase [Pseudomonadota bacterium]
MKLRLAPEIANGSHMTAKLVLVTGASSGIGEAIARQYGRAGAHVLLLARNADRLEHVAKAIQKDGGSASLFPVDLQNREAATGTAMRIVDELGAPDILINNAGMGRWLPLVDTSFEDARAMMGVPYFAAFDLTRALSPAMIARGSGSIGFITSPASYLAWPNASAYIAARRALAGFAEGLQSELKPKGIAVTIAVLGAVDTPYFKNNPGSRENVPHADPRLLPVLRASEAADAVVAGIEARKRFVIKPAAYRALFVLNALFPKTVAKQIRRASKKAKRAKEASFP